MKRLELLMLLVFVLIQSMLVNATDSMTTEEFTFESSGLNLNGIISQPSNIEAKSLVIVIPGHGPTNVVEGNWYYELRSKFNAVGVAVAIWDRPGCGKSEGEYDHNQSVHSSADEAVAAIHSIRSNRVPGYERIGMWGASRGGWIAPLAMDKDPDISFWISVSGTDAFETWGYLFRSTLVLEGHSEKEAEFYYNEWIKANQIFAQGASYSEYQRETDALRRNQIYQKLAGQAYLSPEEGSEEFERERLRYEEIQEAYIAKGQAFDDNTGLPIIVRDFDRVLNKISVPVLAIFGDNDRHVDWRRTKALYERTMGSKEPSSLTVKVFAGADHSIRMSKTGGYFETMQREYWQTPYAEGYYEAMIEFVCSNGFCAGPK